jgi:hypothetical protein
VSVENIAADEMQLPIKVVVDLGVNRAEFLKGARARNGCIARSPFGTLKAWMGGAHFLIKTLEKAEMSLQVLAYNMKRILRERRNRGPTVWNDRSRRS